MTEQEFNRQYDKATSYRARILDELLCGDYFGNLPAKDLYEALCERLDKGDPINIEESEMKTILCEIADRLGRLEDAQTALTNLGAELAMAANALPERRVAGVWAAFRELESKCATTA